MKNNPHTIVARRDVELIKTIKPHTLVKGGDYEGQKVVGQDLVSELKLVNSSGFSSLDDKLLNLSFKLTIFRIS